MLIPQGFISGGSYLAKNLNQINVSFFFSAKYLKLFEHNLYKALAIQTDFGGLKPFLMLWKKLTFYREIFIIVVVNVYCIDVCSSVC